MIRVVDGVIQGDRIGGVPFSARIVRPLGSPNVRSKIPMEVVLGTTNHNTANTAKTADAEMHAAYLQNIENLDSAYVSWHFTVDDDSIVQHIPMTEVTWHAGDGSGDGNMKTISIEIAENGDYAAAERNAVILNAEILQWLDSQGKGKAIYKHQDWSGKYCPRRILNGNRWGDFVNRIKLTLADMSNVKPSLPDLLYRVQTGAFRQFENAVALENKLISAGFDTYVVLYDGLYKVQVGAFGIKDNAERMAAKLRSAGFATYITEKSGVPVSEKAIKPAPQIKQWSRVRVKQGARDWSGVQLNPEVYRTVYTVIELKGDRAVIGLGSAVTAAIHVSNLYLA